MRIQGPIHEADSLFFSILLDVGVIDSFTLISQGRLAVGEAGDRESARQLMDAEFMLSDEFEWGQFRKMVIGYLRTGDTWSALWLSELALSNQRRSPTDAALDLLCMVHEAAGRPLSALGLLAARKDPIDREFEVQLKYVESMLYLRHLPVALRSVERAHEAVRGAPTLMSVDSAVMANAEALILFRQGRISDALCRSTDAIEYGNGVAAPPAMMAALYANRARVYEAMDRPDEASLDFLEAVALDAKSPEVVLPWIRFMGKRQDVEGAVRALENFQTSDEVVPEIVHARAVLADRAGAAQEACRLFAQAASLSPLSIQMALDSARAAVMARQADAAVYVDEVGRRLNCRLLNGDDLSTDDRVEVALLELQLDIYSGLSEGVAKERLLNIAKRFPASGLVSVDASPGAP